MKATMFSTLLQAFFTDYLVSQRQASQHTIASYRDTFRLLLRFAQKHLNKAPAVLTLDDIDASFVRKFLTDLEIHRKISARTRNQRLAAIHSCFCYAALQYPEKSATIQQIMAIPQKRFTCASIDYLTSEEVGSVLATPDQSKWSGRRDYTLMLTGIRTGLRVSELTGLLKANVTFGTGAHICCIGKGRKERSTPLTKLTALVLKQWLNENKQQAGGLVFTNARGGHLSVDGVQYILDKHVAIACKSCTSLNKKRVTAHVLRHTTAMQLLQSGVDPMMIAIWLGHESVETTQIYVKEDLKMKEQAISKTKDTETKFLSYQPDDDLLTFLNAL